jgi:hypothetical protein
MKSSDKIIPQGFPGPQARQLSAVRARIRSEIRTRYASKLEHASLIKCMQLAWEIEREVRAELAKIYPPGALYATFGKTRPHNNSPGPASGAVH